MGDSLSGGTISTFLHEMSHHSGGSHQSNSTQCTWLFNPTVSPSPDLISGFSGVYTNGSIGTIYSTGSAQGIYVFGKDQITLGRMIGQVWKFRHSNFHRSQNETTTANIVRFLLNALGLLRRCIFRRTLTK